jgi:hypothetical protein
MSAGRLVALVGLSPFDEVLEDWLAAVLPHGQLRRFVTVMDLGFDLVELLA